MDSREGLENKMQSIIITFDDGTRAKYTGPAAIAPGDTRGVVRIEFTIPRRMPDDVRFEVLDENNRD